MNGWVDSKSTDAKYFQILYNNKHKNVWQKKGIYVMNGDCEVIRSWTGKLFIILKSY